MNTADLIWQNGEFVAWEDAKVHVLTHALHYGTSVFEGVRAYETERGPAIFRHDDHLDRLEASAKLYYMDLPFSKEQLREATHELIGRNGFRSCYIRPLVFRGHGPMGLDPEDNPVEVIDRGVGVGRLPGRGGQEERRARQGLLLAADQPAVADPALQGRRPVPQLGAGEDRVQARRLRRGDPARRPRPRLRGLGREHVRGQGRQDRHPAADRQHPRRHQPQVDHRRSPPTSGLERRGARRRARRAHAGRRGVPGRAPPPSWCRCARSTTSRSARPARSRAQIQQVYDDALHGRDERYAEWLDVVAVPSKA